MNNNKKFEQTKQVIKYSLKFIKGKTLDLGAGKGKYKPLIQQACSEYVAFDVIPNENIDVVGDILNTGFQDESFGLVSLFKNENFKIIEASAYGMMHIVLVGFIHFVM